MLGARDYAAIVAGLGACLSQVRIVRLIGRSPSVVCREITRHTGLDGEFRVEEAERSRPAMERDMNLPECIGAYIWGSVAAPRRWCPRAWRSRGVYCQASLIALTHGEAMQRKWAGPRRELRQRH